MTTETGAPAAEQSAAPADTSELSLQDAMAMIDAGIVDQKIEEDDGSVTKKSTENTNPQQAREQPRAAEPEPSEEENADPEEAPRDDETNEADPQEAEPIEPPRSWTKEAREQWNSLPRQTQEYLAQREQERDRGLRQSQNEIAEQRKAFEAEREAVRQLRQQYESKLPDLARTLEQALQNDFGDIKDLNDVRKLQMEDPFRFQQWQLRQMELAAAQKEQSDAEVKRTQEKQAKWNDYTQAEDKKFSDGLSDKDRAALKDLMAEAPKFLEDKGFTQQELARMWNENETFRDHRMQLLILDAMKFRSLQNAPKAVAPKNLPPVQKPGSANAASPQDANIRALEQRLNKTGSMEDAWALYEAQLKAQNRRAS